MMRVHTKGQATVEMAILGSLILMLFGALVSMGVSMNEQQTLLMESFRKAQKRAYYDNGFVSYSVLKHVRAPSPGSGPYEGNRQSASAGSNVLWTKGENENFAYMKVNEAPVIAFERYKKKGEILIREIEDSRFAAESHYHGTISDGLTSAAVDDTITTTLQMKDAADIVITQSLDEDGRYRTGAIGMNKN